MTRGSKKPCPGCGEVHSSRPVDELCRHCKDLLAKAAWMEKQLAVTSEEIVVATGQKSHWNKYLYSHSGHGRDVLGELHRVVLCAGRQVNSFDEQFSILGDIQPGAAIRVAMNRPLAEAIRDLRNVIQVALTEEYEAGKKDGHNLLKRLATGDLAVNEFMKNTEK